MTGLRTLKGIVALMALVMVLGVAAAEQQTSNEGGVVVRVTPGRLTPEAATWDFEVVFETHTTPLTGDPAQFTVLIDPQWRAHAPLRWDGDPPGSHHRKGVLRFKPIRPAPATVTLKIRGIGGVAERVFTWSIADR
jgi:hypothetical protein